MKVLVIGTGYVGTVQAAALASAGHDVICVDKDERRVRELSNGRLPFYEPGLEQLLNAALSENKLRFNSGLERVGPSTWKADLVFICVGTPATEDGSADLTALETVCSAIYAQANGSRAIPRGTPIVVKSTVPPGTTVDFVKPRLADYRVAMNPEFLKEGDAVRDFMHPDRIVLGVEDDESWEKLEALYVPFVRSGQPILRMDPTSAELTKYASNAMLAARISMMNEIALAAEISGADIELVRRGVGTDRRIGPSFLFPGIGFGGSCFGKDVLALRDVVQKRWHPYMLDAILDANERALQAMFDRHVGIGEAPNIAVWGLSFKPNTDDIRDAPAIKLIRQLLERYPAALIKAHDPVAIDKAKRVFDGRVTFAADAIAAAAGAEILFVCTEWSVYRNADLGLVASQMAKPSGGARLVDGRNIFSPSAVKAVGLRYFGVGRRPS